jgi:hypothetical protein
MASKHTGNFYVFAPWYCHNYDEVGGHEISVVLIDDEKGITTEGNINLTCVVCRFPHNFNVDFNRGERESTK